MTNITGELREWVIIENIHGCYITGEVRKDVKGRFSDGVHIHTSQVTGYREEGASIVVTTLNSKYLMHKSAHAEFLKSGFDISSEIKKLERAAAVFTKANEYIFRGDNLAFKKG